MLSERIISTLRFFDLQDLPLTLLEIHKFLIGETTPNISEIQSELENLVKDGKVTEHRGYYALKEREGQIQNRLSNYEYGIAREKLIKKYAPLLRHIPFVRGVSLAGSQALGQEKATSDIDLLIITAPGRMWTARTFVTAYFHLLGLRRHDKLIANRFCLNHYISGEKLLTEGRSFYTAMEYAKLRPLVYTNEMAKFTGRNLPWIREFFPNVPFSTHAENNQPSVFQKWAEKLFSNNMGNKLEAKLKDMQKKRIHTDQYVRVAEDELSFHPASQEEKLLSDFLKFQQ